MSNNIKDAPEESPPEYLVVNVKVSQETFNYYFKESLRLNKSYKVLMAEKLSQTSSNDFLRET